MKNLFDTAAAEKLIERVQQLQADTQPKWGTMSATEMLLHCNKVHEQLLQPAKPITKKTSAKQYLLRWLVLYVMPTYPKGAQAPKPLQTKGTIDVASFAEQQQAFVAMAHQLSANTQPVEHRHPYFGNLNTKQWGRAGWKHVDHHLRQFGV